ncbi:rab-like protein 3 [Adelges cooleyi]|uniref:rab-like protein 3 n=1 Tax=Adelges cooleyi TaxID=133065 RepID=UPI00217F8E26|nr:rab-like protein 3 [Adelges cooleyi]XP_050431739.1 rab-like protein 3 [Adelges cooleyi]XP_050431740.1 rab-like protein 3 [Adelges cooleyi]XP_050431741.1 rab-like protein 3 [Adelges cooleyi]XP_050431742.1 rab-like protein 3 [Adelges cooleyi]
MEISMASTDSVKVLVVGDSGVGKTSLVNIISNNKAVKNPKWTVGVTVELKLYKYMESTPRQRNCFIEMWDIGGSSNHKNTRHIFYNSIQGIILVYDLTNLKSSENLHKWLAEIMNKDNNAKYKYTDDFDMEQLVGSNRVPILVCGTKLDMAPERGKKSPSTVAAEFGADEILLNCHDSKQLENGTIATSKLNNFLDRVIQIKYPISNSSPFSQGLYSRQHQYQSPQMSQYPSTRQIIYDGLPTVSKNTFFQNKTIHKD